MLHYETVKPGTLELLKQLQQMPELAGTRLVGGTALALQLGHRSSVDLDFFGAVDATAEELRDAFEREHDMTVVAEYRLIRQYMIDYVKVDVVNLRNKWLEDAVIEDGIALAGLKDIAALKINAIVGRGSKKDFIDIAVLLDYFSLREMLEFFIEKYPAGEVLLALKSLCYFEDAEVEAMPPMFIPLTWEDVKKRVMDAVDAITY